MFKTLLKLIGLLVLLLIVAAVAIGFMLKPKDLPTLVSYDPAARNGVLIQNVAVLDVESGRLQAGRDVLVEGDKILRIDAGGTINATEGVAVIHGKGQTLVPGFVDAHTHALSLADMLGRITQPNVERNLESFLYSGVTTIFNAGESDNKVYAFKQRVADGEIPGPQMFVAGKFITAPGGHPVHVVELMAPKWIRWYLAPRVAHQASTADDARAAVAENQQDGADFIKVMVATLPGSANRISPEVLQAVVDEAHQRGLKVVAHIDSTADALMAGKAGVDHWVHGVYYDRIPDEKIQTLAEFNIPMTPSMIVFENISQLGRGTFKPIPLELETADPDALNRMSAQGDGEKVHKELLDWFAHLRGNRADWDSNTQRLHNAGVTLFVGTDFQSGLFPGPSFHREMALLKKAGISNKEIIRAATINPARFLSNELDPPFGVIKIGKQADLVLVKGNPLDDINALSNITQVIVRGRLLKRHAMPSQ